MYILEKKSPFAQSQIWQFQRDYFSQKGIAAWSRGEVPHYATSNPIMGKSYAELVLAFLRDLSMKGQMKDTVYLLELGAGHGRLCYHFFKHFEQLYEQSTIPLPPFCYVLSDFAEANLDFWRTHPSLQPFLTKGWLDFALFDAENSQEIILQQSGISVGYQSLQQPLVVIGNYFFDTIPQELFWVENGALWQCMLSLSSAEDPATLSPAALLHSLERGYTYEEISQGLYAEQPYLRSLLAYYSEQLSQTHFLFPHIGIRCMHRLQALSHKGILLLTADKGNSRLEELKNQKAPALATHGSFSLNVNYHAFIQYCEEQGGLALFPLHRQSHLDLGCLFLMPEPETYIEANNACERFVNDYGPDDYLSVINLIEKHFETLTFRDIFSILRLCRYDTRIFLQMCPQLLSLVPDMPNNDRSNLLQAVHRVWDMHYPIGEDTDLAFEIGFLLYDLSFYKEAIVYFNLSINSYGKKSNALFNIALCHYYLEEFVESQSFIEELRAWEPDNEKVQALEEQLRIKLGGEPILEFEEEA